MLAGFNADTDISIWTALKQGDRNAFAFIYEKHIDGLLQYGMTLTRDKDLVRDCAQELFITCWKQREKLADVQAIRYYLLISLKRLIIRQLKKKRLFPDLRPVDAGNDFVLPHDNTLLQQEAYTSEKKALLQEISKLPKRQQEAIFLRFYEELSYEEIASIMNLNYQGARNIIYKSVKTLRKNMINMNKWRHLLFPILFLSHHLLTL